MLLHDFKALTLLLMCLLANGFWATLDLILYGIISRFSKKVDWLQDINFTF